MSWNIYVIITIGGILGILLHVMKAIRNIRMRTQAPDLREVLQEYWKSDKLTLLISCFAFLVLLFVSSEYVNLNELQHVDKNMPLKEKVMRFKIAFFIKTASVIAGYFSDSIVYGFMGVTEVRLKKRFDEISAEKPPA